jgi:hypothetical protein
LKSVALEGFQVCEINYNDILAVDDGQQLTDSTRVGAGKFPARPPYKQGVAGSSPAPPTISKQVLYHQWPLFLMAPDWLKSVGLLGTRRLLHLQN